MSDLLHRLITVITRQSLFRPCRFLSVPVIFLITQYSYTGVIAELLRYSLILVLFVCVRDSGG